MYVYGLAVNHQGLILIEKLPAQEQRTLKIRHGWLGDDLGTLIHLPHGITEKKNPSLDDLRLVIVKSFDQNWDIDAPGLDILIHGEPTEIRIIGPGEATWRETARLVHIVFPTNAELPTCYDWVNLKEIDKKQLRFPGKVGANEEIFKAIKPLLKESQAFQL